MFDLKHRFFSDVGEDKMFELLRCFLEIGELRSVDAVLEKIADVTAKLIECDRVSIFIYDKNKDTLWTKFAHGVDEKIEVPKDKGVVGWVFTRSEQVIIHDPYSDPRFNKEIDRVTGYTTRNILAVPLITYSGNTVGVLECINKLKGRFEETDLNLARVLSTHAANSIENALLYEELKKAQSEIILRLSLAAEFKDKTTYKHLMRIANYSYIIAKEMGFPDEWCEKLKLAAPMHDIGKLGIKDQILLKPAKLSPEEFDEMKKHTIYGYDILRDSDIEVLKMASNIAKFHHERYDGTGYPFGLKGDEIPIEARIVAVADVFDALVSERPYKEAIPVEDAVKIIEDDSGKHFDPMIVQAFKRALDKIISVKKSYE